ncbi:related to nuclear protein bimA [Sporisorium reilianum SRZ2]|uniref:Related to nuclear protein bimA n=1 Tax=Sporisorium reilianum (strain SRZ2) TaxID=999809 RepID=E6ZZF0_SPORE|nr:related to nuclear protein bimA [Sporisorium reilianum SRZ2]
MPLAASAPRSRLTATKSRQPIASSSSSSSSSAHPTTTSIRSKPAAAASLLQSTPAPPPLLLPLPPTLPTLSQLELSHDIQPSPHLIARRLISLARSFLALHSDDGSDDPLDWELDLCSATFFSIYAVCLDPASIIARTTLARCARLGGFNIVLPFSPSASAASATVSAARLSSHDPHDMAGANACIHILQQGSAATFQHAASAKEYRDACRTLGRPSEAAQVSDVLRDKVLGKRKAADPTDQDHSLPQPVSMQSRYHSQLHTDEAYNAASRARTNEAHSSFIKALDLDPFNWRAWAGLCDTGYGAASASKHLGPSTLDRLYSSLVAKVQAPYVAMKSSLKSSPPFSHDQNPCSTTMIRKVSEDGSNKKLKVSSEIPPVPSLPPNAARNGIASRPIDKVTPPLPTTSASTVTATRLHPTSRALSAAQTNTHHLEPLAADQDDVKAAKAAGIATRPTRTAGVRTATVAPTTTANARQLRSTRGNATAPTAAAAAAPNGVSRAAAAPNRAGATSQAGSVSSTSSGSSTSSMSSRATVSTARTAVSNRRVASAAPTQPAARTAPAKPTSASSARATSTSNGTATALPPKRTTASASNRLNTTTAASVSRPGSAMSKASSTSAGAAAPSARTNSTLASSRTAAEAMRLKEEEDARAKLEHLTALRGPIVQQLTAMAHQQAADRYVLALLAQVGEAYRLLRLCEGGQAAAVLLASVLEESAAITGSGGKSESKKAVGDKEGSTGEGSSTFVVDSSLEMARILDRQVKDSLLHHLLLGRSYAECSQYAASETHFAAIRKLNPFIAAHMDIYSLVLFHLSREVKLSALAQHLAMVAPGTASTHIVVGNAFSLQKEHQTALVCFQRAAAAAPDYAYAYTLTGHEAHDLGLHDEAIAYFRSAIRCDRRHWNAWAGLGRVYLGIGEHEHAACKSLQQAIALNAGNYILWDLVGWTFSLLNAPGKALECYDRAIELAESAAVLTYLRRAELLLQHGDAESSHRDLVRAHDLAPEEASIHILLAQSYMRLGGGGFCHLEGAPNGTSGKATAALRASGVMVLPAAHHAEITHHLSVAIDLDPSLLRLVKSICEGYKTLPGSKLSIHPNDLTADRSYTQSQLDSVASGYASVDESHMRLAPGYYRQQQQHDVSAMANSTPHLGMMLPPADFAASHPAHDASSFLSMHTRADSSADIVLEDADGSR